MPEIIDQVYSIPLSDIHADTDFNCRGAIAPIDVYDLVQDIDKNGLQSPVLIQEYPDDKKQETGKTYKLLAGFRRFKAHQVLRCTEIPSIIKKGLSDVEARILNLNENLQRKNLNILQEALAIKQLKMSGLTEVETANRLNMSRGWVQIRFMLLSLPEDIQALASTNLFSQDQIRQLYSMTPMERILAVRDIKDARLKGEKIRLKKDVKNLEAKKQRNRIEIFTIMDHIRTTIGVGFGTRCLAWAAGEISNFELAQDIKSIAVQKGINYEIPVGFIKQ